jgi:hypothetical protein
MAEWANLNVHIRSTEDGNVPIVDMIRALTKYALGMLKIRLLEIEPCVA